MSSSTLSGPKRRHSPSLGDQAADDHDMEAGSKRFKLELSPVTPSKSQDQTVMDEPLPAYPSDDVPTLRAQLATFQSAVKQLGAKLVEKDALLSEAQALDPGTKIPDRRDPSGSSDRAEHFLELELTKERERSTKLEQDIKNLHAKTSQDEETIKNQRQYINSVHDKWVEATQLMKAVGVNSIAELAVQIKAKDDEIASASAKTIYQQDSTIAQDTSVLESGHDDEKIQQQAKKDSQELQQMKRKLSFATDANNELEHAAKQLAASKAEQKATIIKADEELKRLRADLTTAKAEQKATIIKAGEELKRLRAEITKRNTDQISLGGRLAKRASYIAQMKQVIRSSGGELPKPVEGMEFFGWDDYKAPAEAVDALKASR